MKFNLNNISLAKDLFLKMVALKYEKRYTASECLLHPWITRKFDEPIPNSAYDKIQIFKNISKLMRFTKIISCINYFEKEYEK